MMLRSCCLRCFGRRNGDALLWHTDLKPHASGEFSIAVVQANSNLEDQSQVYTSPSATYVGVYDGHGGPEASRFVNRHLFLYLHTVDGLPADKRACSSLEFLPSSSNSSAQTLTSTAQEAQDADMNTSYLTSGSTRSDGDGEKESAYGSCDSNNSIHDYYRNRSLSDQTKFKKVLTSLSEEVEESGQLAQLTELCELLSFCSDSSLSSPMVDSFSPVLVQLARHDTNPDMMLLAIRAINLGKVCSGNIIVEEAISVQVKNELNQSFMPPSSQFIVRS